MTYCLSLCITNGCLYSSSAANSGGFIYVTKGAG